MDDQFDINRQKRRMIALGVLILLTILTSVAYFFWGNLINQGKIKIIAEPPFEVEILGSKNVKCKISPCIIKEKRGGKGVTIKKEGYKKNFQVINVKLWKTSEVKVDFQIIPTLKETSEFPEDTITPEYKLVFDVENNMQKLIEVNDPSEKAIVYFPKSLNGAKIFGNNKYILVVTDEIAYKINSRLNSKEELNFPELLNVKEAKWSLDGRYLLFSEEKKLNLQLIDTKLKKTSFLALTNLLNQNYWINNNQFAFITRQSYSNSGETIDLLDEILPDEGAVFGFYDPEKNTYSKIEDFTFKKPPEKIYALLNGYAIYFEQEGKKYKVTIKK